MGINKKFTDGEKHLFTSMINYFIKAEEAELFELNQPSGNKNFVPQTQESLNAFKSIKEKVEKVFH